MPRRPPAPGTSGLAVFVNVFRHDDVGYRPGSYPLVDGPVVWDGKSERRIYAFDRQEFGWRAHMTVEGNQPELVKKVNAVIDEELTGLSAILAERTPATQPAAGWHLLGASKLGKLEVEKTLYDKPGQEHFFIHVRVLNTSDRPIAVDLRNYWRVIYPNQWGPEDQARRGVINEPHKVTERSTKASGLGCWNTSAPVS